MEARYQPGNQVRIIDAWGPEEDFQNDEGKMDHWLGQTMTIREIESTPRQGVCYRMEEDKDEWDGPGWLWPERFIAGLEAESPPPVSQQAIDLQAFETLFS